MTVLGTVIVRWLYPVLAVSFAAGNNTYGILNYLSLPSGLEIPVGILLLDLVIYGQHVLFHTVPLLWRFHMMHHADLDIDVTTGLRFHPIEIALSMGIKLGAVIIIGPPVLAVILFEILLNGTSMFNHGNILMPAGVDRLVRLLVVTPDMHRVHHSVVIRETNSNFGFNFPWWDRLFGTYRAQPSAGHEKMTIGLSLYRDEKKLSLPRLLVMPFTGKPGAYPILRNPKPPKENKP
jgi:sterol desaturase/sphingolipid hydroxylase (fatty acid hydroxylase superfamily)